MRHTLVFALLLAAACSPPAPSAPASPPAAQVTPPATDSPYPFPTITGATREVVLTAACAYAKDHFLLPQRAVADTPVSYRSVTGSLSDGQPEVGSFSFGVGLPSTMGFHDTYVTNAADTPGVAFNSPPLDVSELFEHAGTFRAHVQEMRTFAPNTMDPSAWCALRLDQGAQVDYDRHRTACLRVTRVATAPHVEMLDSFTNYPIKISDDILIAWSGYRWSGNGGALILLPTVDRPDGQWAIGQGPQCPDIVIGSDGGYVNLPAYRDTAGWLEALAPQPMAPTAAH